MLLEKYIILKSLLLHELYSEKRWDDRKTNLCQMEDGEKHEKCDNKRMDQTLGYGVTL